jgi:MFS family permease
MGAATDKYGPRLVIGAGALLMGAGMILTALISELWQLYLIYALLISGGVAAVYVPLTTTVSRWFHTKLGLALGLLNAGSGVGMIVMSPMAGALISFYNVRTAYVVIGCTVLILSVLCAQFLRKEPQSVGLLPYGYSATPKPEPDQAFSAEDGQEGVVGLSFKEALNSKPFQALAIIAFMYGVCFFTVTINIVPHATDLGIPSLTASTILSVIGGFFIVGVLVIGNAADRFGHKKLLALCIVLLSASVIWLTSLTSFALFSVFSVLIGFAYGGIRVTLAGVSADLFGSKSLGTIFGSIIAAALVGGAIGTVLGNIIYELSDPHSYNPAFWITGAGLLVSSSLFMMLPRR